MVESSGIHYRVELTRGGSLIMELDPEQTDIEEERDEFDYAGFYPVCEPCMATVVQNAGPSFVSRWNDAYGPEPI